jgi:16S rRNA processing protein RimM
MEKDQCFEFGRFGKPVGHQGGIRLHHETDDVSVYVRIKWVLLELGNGLVPFAIKSFRLRTDDTVYLELEGIDTEEKARELQGIQAFLPLEALPKLSGNKFYFHEVIGWKASDTERGDIGIIKNVFESGHQHLFSIEFEGREILIPVQDAFIRDVDRQAKTMTFQTPEGLIDLYLSDTEDQEDFDEKDFKEMLGEDNE